MIRNLLKSVRNLVKNISVVLSSIILITLLCGCSNRERVLVGVSQCSYDDWRLKLNEEMQREALLHENLDLEIRSAYDDPDRQVEDIRYFIDKGADVIVASPQNTENLNAVLAEARAKGIKVIDFDRQPSTKCYDTFIGADNLELGHAAGVYLINQLPAGAKFLEIFGSAGSTPAGERSTGFREAMRESGKMVLLDSARGDWSTPQAEHVVDSLLRLHPDIDAIFAHNDRMAIGAANAVRKAGLDSVLIAGIDAVPETGIKAVADGLINVTFTYPTAGKELIDLALKAASGKKVTDRFIITSLQPVDQSNAKILLELSESINDDKAKIGFLQERINHFSSTQTLQRTLLIGTLLLVILLAGLLYFILKAYWQRKRSQAALAERNALLSKQRDELESLNKQLQEATQSKLRFFTNVSHDLRTPLTLIAEPLRSLEKASNLSAEQSTLLRLAQKNVLILQRLINQILDFRKFENSQLKVNLTEGDIKQYLETWTDAFHTLARRHHIRYDVELNLPTPAMMAFDAEKMERIMFNLLGNAFKFTPDNGRIRINASLEGDKLRISVSNTGKGINAEELPRVFDRFYQAGEVIPQGSGIGLALVKSFVELHHGSVGVESELNKQTVFTVLIPITHVEKRIQPTDNPERIERINMELGDVDSESYLIPSSQEQPEKIESLPEEDKPQLLIIDDTADIRTLLRTLLSNEYTILEASNGKQGIRMASKYCPDLIICDMMMPEMDGLECVRAIKNETSTSHIPILMLTACKLDEQRAEAYEAGADGYISKPFSSEVLLARCHSLIANRLRLSQAQIMPSKNNSAKESEDGGNKNMKRENSGREKSSAGARSLPVDAITLENDFYRRFMQIVDEELSNADISVEDIGSKLGLSRVQFYRKIKALTNFSPVELIRIRRLNEAYRLLSSTEKTVAEIAYSVGFSTPGYFAKCFKEQFGELPGELQKRTSKIN